MYRKDFSKEDRNKENSSGKNDSKSGGKNQESEKDSEVVNLSLVSYWFLAAVRIILTLLPQTGYIHPDEYFQSIEVVAGDIFNVESSRPWEFNSTFPVRSIVIPYVFVGLPLFVLKNISPFINLWFDCNIVTPYLVLILPRLVCCLLSFLTDYSLYRICLLYGQNYRIRLLTLASSYVVLVYSTHTFSNSIEMALTSVLIYLVADCMCRTDFVVSRDEFLRDQYSAAENWRERIHFYKLRTSLPGHSLSKCFIISSVSVLGTFNRPTFLAFAFAPIFFWLQRGMGSKYIGFSDFNQRSLILVIAALPSVLILILLDSVYFGYLTFAEILNQDIRLETNFVVTPYNFIKYNLNVKNLAQHGLHSKLTHLLLNIPLLYNVLGLAAILAFFNIVVRLLLKRWSDLPRMQSLIGLMMTSLIIPLVILSFIPHQEPRFLIPCTLSIIFLHSQRIRNVNEPKNIYSKQKNGFKVFLKKDVKMNTKDIILMIWYLINILCVLFFGFLHQAGVYPLITHLSHELQYKPRLTHIHLVTSHIYSLPMSLLLIKKYSIQVSKESGMRYNRAKDFFMYELGSSESMDQVAMKIKTVLNTCETKWKEKHLKYKLYFALPSSLTEEFQVAAFKMNLTHSINKVFYPHVSTEALPNLRVDAFKKCKDKYKNDTETFLFYDWGECTSDSSSYWNQDLSWDLPPHHQKSPKMRFL
ncbi:phosphatidylinositol glycan anchor biosynthesis class Z isoform X2 [Lycorma delicatula]|uniref:phosphatidylinositol glycan anchor biosynthesis class Z isoform X2 n=1 Tax=Lycorma delicatula TaxID=130591 RepID=UPI003F50D8F6